MNQVAETLVPGQIARVRQQTYLVEEVVKPKRAADSTLVRLSCADDDNQGQPLEVLWEKELDPQVPTGEAWEAIASKGFDDSRLFGRFTAQGFVHHDLSRACFAQAADSILDANKRYWAKRLDELREELKTEPARIKRLYQVKAKRVEPVGLVYLWPVTG